MSNKNEASSWIRKYTNVLREAMSHCHAPKNWDFFIEHFLLNSGEFAVFHALIYHKLAAREFDLLIAMAKDEQLVFLDEERDDQQKKVVISFNKFEDGLLTFLKLQQRLEGKGLTHEQVKKYLESILKIADSACEDI